MLYYQPLPLLLSLACLMQCLYLAIVQEEGLGMPLHAAPHAFALRTHCRTCLNRLSPAPTSARQAGAAPLPALALDGIGARHAASW